MGGCALVARIEGPDPMPDRVPVWVRFVSPDVGRRNVKAEARGGVLRIAWLPCAEIELSASVSGVTLPEHRYGSAGVVSAPNRIAECTLVLRRKP